MTKNCLSLTSISLNLISYIIFSLLFLSLAFFSLWFYYIWCCSLTFEITVRFNIVGIKALHCFSLTIEILAPNCRLARKLLMPNLLETSRQFLRNSKRHNDLQHKEKLHILLLFRKMFLRLGIFFLLLYLFKFNFST